MKYTYYIVFAVEENFGFLAYQTEAGKKNLIMTSFEESAHAFGSTENAHDVAADLKLDSYEVVEKGYGVVTDCPEGLFIKSVTCQFLN